MAERFASLVLPTPVDQEFDYIIPEPFIGHVARGVRATVEFGKRKLTGFVVGVKDSSPLGAGKLKPLLDLPDDGPLADEGTLKLTQWIAEYYACSWGEALEAAIPAVIRRKRAVRAVNILRLGKSRTDCAHQARWLEDKGKKANSPYHKQAKVLRTLLTFHDKDFRPSELAEQLGFSEAPIATLIKQGWLSIEKIPIEDFDGVNAAEAPDEIPDLTVEQERAVNAIAPSIERDEYKTFLLYGVTGSGKTEVYLRALKHVLELGKGGIVLVPEISLAPQTVRRFSARLGGVTGIAVLHSAMTDADRRREWKRIVSGEARVVIGPRSAVFAPVRDLGLVIVDEEHEPSYKQDNTPRYHARDAAVMRCFQQNAVCLLGSATPSLESASNAVNKRYTLLELTKRVAERPLPRVTVVDMKDECRAQRRFTFFSNALTQAVSDAVKAKEQAILFLNRRGYSTFFQCDTCREVLMCENCDVPMSLHKSYGQCICHYCLETKPTPRICPKCMKGAMQSKGAGTEFIEEEIKARFADARVARMDSDVMKSREDYEELLDRFRAGEIDVLVGTQMIAKGLDFPRVTVVGVIHADLSLYLADFRAHERTFQLLTQVSGRAGRGTLKGRVFVQTFAPEHPCIQAAQAQDYWAFYKHEISQRKIAAYPPFVRLINVGIEARDPRRGQEMARKIRADLDDLKKLEAGVIVDILGPSAAPIARLRGRHRQQVLVKVRDHKAIGVVSARIRKWGKGGDAQRIVIDVDPYSLL
ncbi:MAG: primosomal protein N' [Planctomycetes bacterium]|nr:primosomal protein N' [Planctomycetota bacterium]NUQ34228.1 primosomal protein N' [Planctomycetaceae bacterium]